MQKAVREILSVLNIFGRLEVLAEHVLDIVEGGASGRTAHCTIDVARAAEICDPAALALCCPCSPRGIIGGGGKARGKGGSSGGGRK
eukprot:3274596-Pyramimonas_sp.AAC.2